MLSKFKLVCEYCEDGVCTYQRTVEEQWDDEQDGLPMDYCDGSEEYMRLCFGDDYVEDKLDYYGI